MAKTSAVSIGVLHPGAMGASVAAAAARNVRVLWASEGRGSETVARAMDAGLEDVGTLEALVRDVRAIISVCPPHAAEEVARAVAQLEFRGTYVDANAISPTRARKVGEIVASSGASLVDGGIVGGPAWQPGTTRLYLSGDGAAEVAEWFDGSPLGTVGLAGPVGAASALKMTYAAYTKGTSALITAILAVAEREGVREALLDEWSRSQSPLLKEHPRRLQAAAPKAWRWVAEMEEIAGTFEAAGLPGGFHRGAADLFQRLEQYRDAEPPPAVDEIISAVLRS